MGLKSSGEVSDAALHSLAEKDFATNPDIMTRYSILFYGRFKDDVLVISKGDNALLAEWLSKYREKRDSSRYNLKAYRGKVARCWTLAFTKASGGSGLAF